jgi:hypothetical protein
VWWYNYNDNFTRPSNGPPNSILNPEPIAIYTKRALFDAFAQLREVSARRTRVVSPLTISMPKRDLAQVQFDKTEREAPFQLAALIARPMRVQA